VLSLKKKSQQEVLKELFTYIINDNTPSDKFRKIDNDRSAHTKSLILSKT
jgi:hypothetical protein